MEPLEVLILSGWAFVNRIPTLSKLMETDLPALDFPPPPQHLWVQRGSWGAAGSGMCVPDSAQETCSGFISDSGCGGAPYVTVWGWGVMGHVGSGMSCNLSRGCWCQGGTSPVGLVSVSRKCPGRRSDHITDPNKYSALWEGDPTSPFCRTSALGILWKE